MAKDESAEELASMSVRNFVEILGARTAAPGGGSAAALAASMGAGLGAMMGWMTFGSSHGGLGFHNEETLWADA